MRINATATVELKLEVRVSSHWGDDCTVSQVHDQSESQAIGAVKRLISDGYIDASLSGEPKVTMVLAERST